MIGMVSEPQTFEVERGAIRRMARAFDLPGIDTDPRFQDGKSRRDNAADITAMFDAVFARFTKDEIAARLTAEEIAWAPAQTLADVAVDPQVHAAGGIVQTPGKDGIGSFASPAAPGSNRQARPHLPAVTESRQRSVDRSR
mgnify:CR=1 FL=1